MRISDSKIEEVRLAANIVDVISEKVNLKKRGKNYLGLCPFHTEKTPSFTVSDEKQIFHCFGCHKGGNVFRFIMEYEKVSFIESVEELADKFNIIIEPETEGTKEKLSEQEMLYEINTLSAKYFSDNLLNSTAAENARNYFNERKIKIQTMRAFGLGYSFPEWEHYVNFARDKNIDLQKALHLGLVGSNDDGRLFDKFSGRIIFPIFSPNGRVIAFAGRVLDSKAKSAKYLNSPESLVYSKSKVLYGLSHAKDEIRKLDFALIVEGYMDLIALYQNGIKNVVAVSGTALTDEQSQLLSRYTKNVILFFDSDIAGMKASMRSIEILLKHNMEIKIASLPEGEDPDSFINKFGQEKFEEEINKAKGFIEYQTAIYESQGMFKETGKSAEAIRELVKSVALISDDLKRNLIIKKIAKDFNLRLHLMEAELDKALVTVEKLRKAELKSKEREIKKEDAEISGIETEQNKKEDEITLESRTTMFYKVERDLIKLLYEGDEEIIQFVAQYISPEDFINPIHKDLYNIICKAYEEGLSLTINSLIDKIEDEKIQRYIRELTFEKYPTSKNWEKLRPTSEFENLLHKHSVDSVKKFLKMKIEDEIEKNNRKLKVTDDPEEIKNILTVNKELQKHKTIDISFTVNN